MGKGTIMYMVVNQLLYADAKMWVKTPRIDFLGSLRKEIIAYYMDPVMPWSRWILWNV
jgi:hypothetical protein